jgi:hypothetical protein
MENSAFAFCSAFAYTGVDLCLELVFFFHHLSHLGEGLPQLAYNQAETPMTLMTMR